MSKRVQSFVRIRPFYQSIDSSNPRLEALIKSGNSNSKDSIEVEGITYSFEKVFSDNKTINASNEQVYQSSLQPLLQTTITQAVNSTFFAYGQTCSGKTHTLFGHKDSEPGIVAYALQDIFAQNNEEKTRVIASVGFYEIYNESVTDLLTGKTNLPIKEINGAFTLQGLAEKRIKSAEEGLSLLEIGNANKVMGSSYLHDKSSRSHSVLRLHLAIQSKGVCEVNFVDLAGSEILADNLGSQQQKETKNINMSLFNLKGVIQALSDKAAFVPYRNSALTKLLQNALGGNSQTGILCMISPQQQHSSHSKRTLAFGQTASKIINNLLIPKQIFKNDSDVIKEEMKISENEMKTPNQDISVEFDESQARVYKVFSDGICIYEYGNRPSNKLALFLPAYGSSGKSCMSYSYNSLVNQGYVIASLDYPGQKQSGGTKFNVRGHEQSILLIEKLLSEVFKEFEQILLLGYDYGAALAMNYVMGNSNNTSIGQKKVKQIVSFHPAWSQDMSILKEIKVPVLLLWVTAEQFHPISQGEKMNKIIPKSKLIRLNCGKFSADKPKKAYKCIGDKVTQAILANLEGSLRSKENATNKNILKDNQQDEDEEEVKFNTDPKVESANQQEGDESEEIWDLDQVLDRKEEFLFFGKNVKGACLRRLIDAKPQAYNYLYSPQPPEDPKQMSKWAVGRFKELLISGQIVDYYKSYLTSGPLRSQAIQLFGNLPVLLPSERDTDKFSLFWGEDNLPKNIGLIDNFPSFSPGRRVHVKAKVDPYVFSPTYLKFDKKQTESIITDKAFIEDYDPSQKRYKVKVLPDTTINVTETEIYRLNSPTNFQGNPLAEGLLFEDGIRCKYGDLLTRAKLTEAALSLSDIIYKLDYRNQNQVQVLEIQKKCVERISQCIDLIHLVQEGIHPTRYIAFECGKLAYFGQGNCHTLASVVCAFLLPFSWILGLEVKFRAGSLLKSGRELNETDNYKPLDKWDGKHPCKVEDHTWVEVTYQPSQKSCVFDKSEKINSMQIERTYARHMHISDRNQCNSNQPTQPKIPFGQGIYQSSVNPNELLGEQLSNEDIEKVPYGKDKSVFSSFTWSQILTAPSQKVQSSS